ncbi:hypothetical protein [Pseudomonas asplenii]|uniref:hypothetical protein n=1 Tax=Pseudomonas asplenii TaxID=53407 RepID=UPI0011DC8ADF|nr:hypothetical protein [Pseudomonas fuscovaginae]
MPTFGTGAPTPIIVGASGPALSFPTKRLSRRTKRPFCVQPNFHLTAAHTPLMRHAMYRQCSQRLADCSWLLHRRDLAPEESAYWLIEWAAMKLLHQRQIVKRSQPLKR